MKKLAVVLLFALFILPNYTFAQTEGFELEGIDVGFGRGVLSSGIDVNVSFKSEDATFRLTGNQTRVHGRYQFTKLIPMLKPAITAGFYKDAVWGGIQVAFQPTKFVSTLHWYGVMAGLPEKPDWKLNEFINYHAITVSVFKFDATYAVLSVTKVWKQCVEIKYTQPINNEWKCCVSAGYDITNEFPLYSMVLRYSVN